MRERLVAAVPAQQPRHVDLAVVHLPPLGAPADVAEQRLEHRLGAVDPAGQVVDPGAAGQLVAADPAGERAEGRLLGEVEHRGLMSKSHRPSVRHVRTQVLI